MVLAVLESRSGISFASQDVFLNVAGGLRLSEPAADLAVAAALVSSISKQPVPADTVLFGEIGLTGEVRPVPLTPQRLKEAAKLGFETAVAPFPPARGKARALGLLHAPRDRPHRLSGHQPPPEGQRRRRQERRLGTRLSARLNTRLSTRLSTHWNTR